MENIIKDMETWLINIRRDFHQYPELGYEEFRTSQKIKEYLLEMGITSHAIAQTGIYADIKGEDSSIKIALRADIDALPIQDNKQCSYHSTIDGKMHACGHDVHTTILLGVAKVLSNIKPPCDIRLMFQPAEETDGGAEPMINEGVLDGVHGVLGLHVDPSLPVGQIGIKYGVMNAASDMITIKLHGKSGHGAYPSQGVDTIVMAASVILNLQTIISRNIDGRESAVLSLGVIKGGTARNVIADRVEIEGTIRTLNPSIREYINERVEEVIHTIAESFGGRGEYIRKKGYTALINHDNVVDLIKENGTKFLGEGKVFVKQVPNMGVEDFAYFLEVVPGAFYYLGVGNEQKGITAAIHNENFDIDESALKIGVKMQLLNINSFYNYLKSVSI